MVRERRILDELPPSSPEEPPPPAPPRPRSVPWVCGTLIAGSVLMFLVLDRAFGRMLVDSDGTVLGLMKPLALYGPALREGQYGRLLGFAFEHGNAFHLLLNMSAVWTLGISFERELGSWRFLLLSLITCLGSATFALVFNFDVPTVGASGMILGWAGAMLPLATRQGQRELGIWLIQVAVISLLPGVSWAGHLGGFLFGLPCGLALRLGAPVYARAAPLLLALALGVALYASHSPRFGAP